MNYVFYAKVRYIGSRNETKTTELFTVAKNYGDAAAQIEDAYSDCLLGMSLYGFDADMVYVDDIGDFLKEARREV